MKKILYAAAECAPFIKTGGLGTVVGSVPEVLIDKGYDVRVVLPLYECIAWEWKEQMTKVLDFPVRLGWRLQPAALYEFRYYGVLHYFIGNDFYFSGDSPYSDIWLDVEKFSFFAKAVLELPAYLDYDPEVIHCHDWHTGLIPVYLRTEYAGNPFYQHIRTVMTIHNLKFQGQTPLDHFKDASGLPDDLFTYDKLEYYGCGNMLKGGLAFADRITTVSDTYAREIMCPEYGEGLDGLLKYREEDVSGIVNGIDARIYDPCTDPNICARYDVHSFHGAKKINKKDLQQRTGMPEEDDIFTIAIISRLTEQKGLELLLPVLDSILEERIQFYVLGGGEERFQEMFLQARERYPEKIFVQFNYNDPMAKKMYAGCDAVLMPSLFEPCGLCQLMAFRYGTVPVVRLTGGLVDTVRPYSQKKGISNGFGFEEYSPEALLHTLNEAVSLFYMKPRAFTGIARRCMQEDYSWERQSEGYIRLYEGL
ncbi:MAG: glycogen synthase [Eubacterium sp.]|nr:glycogen synthase [Eubacterium sp.]